MNSPKPYVDTPPLSMILHRVSLFTRYSVLAIMGLIFTLAFSGFLIPVGYGILTLGVVSAVSVMLSQYRWEWVALLPLAGLCIIAAILLFEASTGVVIMLLIVAVASMIERYYHLFNVAKTLRQLPAQP